MYERFNENEKYEGSFFSTNPMNDIELQETFKGGVETNIPPDYRQYVRYECIGDQPNPSQPYLCRWIYDKPVETLGDVAGKAEAIIKDDAVNVEAKVETNVKADVQEGEGLLEKAVDAVEGAFEKGKDFVEGVFKGGSDTPAPGTSGPAGS